MPEARDRLLRPGNDAEHLFKRLRRSTGSVDIRSDDSPPVTTSSGVTATRASGSRRRRRNLYRYSGGENRDVGNRGRRRVLPYWYPRKPLQDITSIVKAFERKRGRVEDQHFVDDPSESSCSSLITPKPTRRNPPFLGKVPKILRDITNQEGGGSELLTPEKKLLNSIDKVEKAVEEEISRLKQTPAAKKAERKAKVRTLMSMR